ncbi:hypothetical protein BDF21DRAFT_487821 [Thamnidium elegans]|nr:hypothetical protein BDF21DRAFT_487821 [Thamnidium elegans]
MFSISGKIIFEDGQENLYNEEGKEGMDWEEDVDPYNLENLANLTQYKEHQPTVVSKHVVMINPYKLCSSIKGLFSTENTTIKYKTYSVDQKTLFLYYIKNKLFKAAKAAKLSGINERTGQQWAKRLREDPE